MKQEMLFRIGKALVYAVVVAGGVIQTGGMPQTTEGWIGLVLTSIVAGWGKYSSNTTFLAPDRTPWTPEQRAQKLGSGL